MHPSYDGAVLGPSPFSRYCHLAFNGAEEQRVYITPVKFLDTCQQQRSQTAPSSVRGGRSALFAAAALLLLCVVGALALGASPPDHAYVHRGVKTAFNFIRSTHQVRQPLGAMPKELRRLGADQQQQQQLHMHSTVRLATVDPAAWAALQQAAAPSQTQQQQQQPQQRGHQPKPAHWAAQQQDQQQQQPRDSHVPQQQQERQEHVPPVQARQPAAVRPRRQQLRLMAF